MKRHLPSALVAACAVLCTSGARAKPAPAPTFVSKPDLALRLPNIMWNDRGFSVRIKRSFKGARQAQLLRKAEAVYPAKAKIVAAANGSLARLDDASLKSSALWWWAKFDGVRVPYAVTSGAAAYYHGLVQQFRRGQFDGANGAPMKRARLDYTASIRHEDVYLLNNRSFRDVHVATLRLAWSQYCGSMCGMSFDRTRTVVLAADGSIAVSGDGAKSLKLG